jgi:hypothetical protein
LGHLPMIEQVRACRDNLRKSGRWIFAETPPNAIFRSNWSPESGKVRPLIKAFREDDSWFHGGTGLQLMQFKNPARKIKNNMTTPHLKKSIGRSSSRLALLLIAVVFACLGIRQSAQAGYIVTLQQVGPDVVATGSGPIDLTGLSIVGHGIITDAEMEPANGGIFTGQPGLSDVYQGTITGPTSFGSGSLAIPNSASGDMVGIIDAVSGGHLLAVPPGYVSGNALLDMATYSGKTFATLGVTPGTYVWTWGTGANQNFTLQIGTAVSPRLSNFSTRAFVQTGDNVMIGGFMVQRTKRVIVRAIGPELTQYGVPDALANPTLELHDATGALIASNNNWATTIIGGIITANQVRDIRNSGHAPGDPFESAIIADLPAGSYTAIVRGVNNTTGVALVEVYDLDQ